MPLCPHVERLYRNSVNEKLLDLTELVSATSSPPSNPCSYSQSHSNLNSLRALVIRFCHRLRSLSGLGLEHLTAVEELSIVRSRGLDLSGDHEEKDQAEEDGIKPRKSFQSLQSLVLDEITRVSALPDGLQYITALRSLHITNCDGLRTLPEWTSNLASLETFALDGCRGLKSLPEAIRFLPNLKELVIVRCSGLTERCSDPAGEDWPNIRHIPHLRVQEK